MCKILDVPLISSLVLWITWRTVFCWSTTPGFHVVFSEDVKRSKIAAEEESHFQVRRKAVTAAAVHPHTPTWLSKQVRLTHYFRDQWQKHLTMFSAILKPHFALRTFSVFSVLLFILCAIYVCGRLELYVQMYKKSTFVLSRNMKNCLSKN